MSLPRLHVQVGMELTLLAGRMKRFRKEHVASVERATVT